MRLGAAGGWRPLQEIARIDVQPLRQGENLTWRKRAPAALEASNLLIAEAESAAEVGLGEQELDSPLADARADMPVDRVGNAPMPKFHD